ncbi:MAG: hypothetical protein JWR10_2444 [Rubritepida sp.]|nr:hypothetical protein [Rubritepida sp.]
MATQKNSTPRKPAKGERKAANQDERKATVADYARLEFDGDGGATLAALKGVDDLGDRLSSHATAVTIAARLLGQDHHQVRQACISEPDAMIEVSGSIESSMAFFRAALEILQSANVRILAGLSYAAHLPGAPA